MSANEVLEALLDAMPDSYQKTIGFPTYDLLAAASLRLAETDAVIEDARAALDPENLTGGELDRYIYPRSGIARKAATFAGGVLTVKGMGTIEQGTLFESAGGVQFAAAETVAIDGTGEVPVTCRADGTAGNLPAHSVTQMPVTVQGIAGCDNEAEMSGGYAEETDAEYYARFLLKMRTPATSGNVYHYEQWALECAGVGHVRVFPRVQGVNTVDVVIADSRRARSLSRPCRRTSTPRAREPEGGKRRSARSALCRRRRRRRSPLPARYSNRTPRRRAA